MRTTFLTLASADVSSYVWMPGKAKESNGLIGSMWPDIGRRWLPTWLPRVNGHMADLPDKSANRQVATTGITLSDEGCRRERAEPPDPTQARPATRYSDPT